jgi:hypothetical protein
MHFFLTEERFFVVIAHLFSHKSIINKEVMVWQIVLI